MANFSGLAVARHRVLADAGWDVEARGLQGAPRVRVVVGEERARDHRHALRYLGLRRGHRRDRARRRPGPHAGRLARGGARRGRTAPDHRLRQAGNVNTGAFDALDDDLRGRAHGTARGCTLTARSGCGRRRPKISAHLVHGVEARTPGRPMRTNG